jgi:S-adenosylmethionine synthetase
MNHNQNNENNDTFLFTSESVGEGHPGKLIYKII